MTITQLIVCIVAGLGAGLGGVGTGTVVAEPVGEVLGFLRNSACHRPPVEAADGARSAAVEVGAVGGVALDLVLDVARVGVAGACPLVHVEGDRPVRLSAGVVVRAQE